MKLMIVVLSLICCLESFAFAGEFGSNDPAIQGQYGWNCLNLANETAKTCNGISGPELVTVYPPDSNKDYSLIHYKFQGRQGRKIKTCRFQMKEYYNPVVCIDGLARWDDSGEKCNTVSCQ